VKEWRRNERDDNVDNKKGYPMVILPHSRILQQASHIFTIRAYRTFEEGYKKSESCRQVLLSGTETSSGNEYKYHVFQKRHPELPEFAFNVSFRDTDIFISCECKDFEESGFLCCHALRILNIHCVQELPDKYFLKRWTRQSKPQTTDHSTSNKGEESTGFIPDIWKVEMFRNFKNIVHACVEDERARKVCEQALQRFRNDVEMEIGTLDIPDVDVDEQGQTSTGRKVLSPISRRKKGEKSVRRKNMSEKIANTKKRGRKSNFQTNSNTNASSTEVFIIFTNHVP
jgi:hypothetical protein